VGSFMTILGVILLNAIVLGVLANKSKQAFPETFILEWRE
jgi:hypothetical protein